MKKIYFILIITFLLPYCSFAQQIKVTISGYVLEKSGKPIEFANILLKSKINQKFISGAISNENGKFLLESIVPGEYVLSVSNIGFLKVDQSIYVGTLSNYLDVGQVLLEPDNKLLEEIKVSAKKDEIDAKLDKKTFTADELKSQSGGSVLQILNTIPGINVQDGKLLIRGSSQVAVLVNGQQTALTGFSSQSGLDNIPASAIEKIELINNPSAKYDANGNAGIVNIIFKKNSSDGLTGKIQMLSGAGALWQKIENLPTIRPQFQGTLKLNPSLSLSKKTDQFQVYFQGDFFHNPTLNKNEMINRYYSNGEVVRQQIKRNRRTEIGSIMTGIDWKLGPSITFSHSILFSSEKILDDGDEPFFNADLSDRRRLWQFLEDELKTTLTATNLFKYNFAKPGQTLQANLNYTWHQEDEKYFFTDFTKSYTDYNDFKLLSDENVFDAALDFQKPLKYGKLESGLKLRYRFIPTNMIFHPGQHTPFDVGAGGWASYKETIPAGYLNYFIDNKHFEVEAGLRIEYVNVWYDVDPSHNTYKSDGYQYFQPFPNFKGGYKFDNGDKLQVNVNRRVDRPAELDIRVFPKYDDAEIIKVGNPALKPQFTNNIELGYKHNLPRGYLYAALYQRVTEGTITRIAVSDPINKVVYNIMQNAGLSSIKGSEIFYSQSMGSNFRYNINANWYRSSFDSFSVNYVYPKSGKIQNEKQSLSSGNLKLNTFFKIGNWEIQASGNYLAPDLIPQGRIEERFGIDLGISKKFDKGKNELFLNASDLFNTMVVSKTIQSGDFRYSSKDYYETQLVRIGFSSKLWTK